MISIYLMLACLFWAGLALLVYELFWYFLEKKLTLLSRIPPEFLEETGPGLFVSRYIMHFAFLVALPTAVYSWFYVMVPFTNLRAGLVLALGLFILGIIPFSVTLLMRFKLPLSYTLFQMAGHLIRLVIVYGIISYLYIL